VSDHPVPIVEHRERERSRVWLPIRLRTDGGEAFAVTYDVSEKGVLLLTREPVAVGTRVTLTFEPPGDPPRTLVATGHVVHAAPNQADPDGLWRHRVGIALDEVLGEFRKVIAELVDASPFSSRS